MHSINGVSQRSRNHRYVLLAYFDFLNCNILRRGNPQDFLDYPYIKMYIAWLDFTLLVLCREDEVEVTGTNLTRFLCSVNS